MTVTTKIVIAAAVVLLLGGYIYMRQHARELASKYKKLQRQKFKSKEPLIIEEIMAQLNGATQKGHINPEHKLQPSFAGNSASTNTASTNIAGTNLGGVSAGGVNNGKDMKIPLEPTTISTPVRLPGVKQSDHQNTTLKKRGGQAQQHRVNTANLTTQRNMAPELPQTSIITKPPIMPPPPNPTVNSRIEEIQLKDIDLPKFVKETKLYSEGQKTGEFTGEFTGGYAGDIRENYPVRGQVKTTGVSEELIFQEDETLYTHINDYAKWVAHQSNHFTLEYYENNTLIEIIPLIFNCEGLSRLNGHWYEMFRPLDLNDLLSGINKSKSTIYCSFSREDVEHLCKPALQILAYVEFEASSRYEKVLEECALKEFVNFLQELKTMANQEE